MNVYFRRSLTEFNELEAITNAGFGAFCQLGELGKAHLKKSNLLVPRYSIEPYAADMFEEFRLAGQVPINSAADYYWCKNLQDWYEDLAEFTFETWFDFTQVPKDTPLVLKGSTNSRKDLWSTHMFAEDKQQAVQVLCNLQDDGLLGMQKHIIRRFQPLVTYDYGPHGVPITKEYRAFCLGNKILEVGYYWHNHTDLVAEILSVDEDFLNLPHLKPYPFVQQIANKVAEVRGERMFYVVDVAQDPSGKWWLVEVNSGEMSGLACCRPDVLYKNLHAGLVNLALEKAVW